MSTIRRLIQLSTFRVLAVSSSAAFSSYGVCLDRAWEDICADVPEWYQKQVAEQTPPYIGFRDTSPGDFVSYNGLEWLTWDQTINMSINQALDVYSADGWRLASTMEVTTLFNNLFYPKDDPEYAAPYIEIYNPNTNRWDYSSVKEFDSAEDRTQYSWHFDYHAGTFFFLENFGLTDYRCDESFLDGCDSYVSAFYGDDLDNDGFYKRAYFRFNDYWGRGSTDAVLEDDKYDANTVTKSLEASNRRSFATGVALVRSSHTGIPQISKVPEINGQGAALALALLSSLMLFFRERYNLKTKGESTIT